MALNTLFSNRVLNAYGGVVGFALQVRVLVVGVVIYCPKFSLLVPCTPPARCLMCHNTLHCSEGFAASTARTAFQVLQSQASFAQAYYDVQATQLLHELSEG